MTVHLTGLAHTRFSEIHSFLENTKLAITSRRSTVPQEVLEHQRELREGDISTLVDVVSNPDVNLMDLVKAGVKAINTRFPDSAAIVS